MNHDKRNWRKGPVAVAVALLIAGGAIAAFPGTASAGRQQTATAEGACDGPEGVILIEIIDSFSTTYNVYIDGVLVDEDITDTDGEIIGYGPYADGTYTVLIEEFEGGPILDTTVEIECTADTTTTVAPTTTAQVAAAAVTQPAFTG